MSGSGVSSNSIFSSQDTGVVDEETNLDALSMLEQGAASYDGSVPSGDEVVEGDGNSSIKNQQRSSSAKVNQEKTLNI